jgi:hypothetical protein
VAPQVGPGEARALTASIVEAITGPTDFYALSGYVATALAPIAPQLRAEDADALTGQIVESMRDLSMDEFRVALLFEALAATARQVRAENAGALISGFEAWLNSYTSDEEKLGPAVGVFVAVVPRLDTEGARALTDKALEVMEYSSNIHIAGTLLVALARRLTWPERLRLIASALKYPTVYDLPRDVLVRAIKEHPEAKTIRAPGDVWAVVEWLKDRPEVDLATPPQRKDPRWKDFRK